MFAELRGLVPRTGDIRGLVVAIARVLVDRAPFEAERRAVVLERFERWDGQEPIDSSAVLKACLDWEEEQRIIRSGLESGRRSMIDELEARDPERDRWASALADLAFATTYEALGVREMSTIVIVSAIERAAYALAGSPLYEADERSYASGMALRDAIVAELASR